MEETRKPMLVELANMLANSWRDPGNLVNIADIIQNNKTSNLLFLQY